MISDEVCFQKCYNIYLNICIKYCQLTIFIFHTSGTRYSNRISPFQIFVRTCFSFGMRQFGIQPTVTILLPKFFTRRSCSSKLVERRFITDACFHFHRTLTSTHLNNYFNDYVSHYSYMSQILLAKLIF